MALPRLAHGKRRTCDQNRDPEASSSRLVGIRRKSGEVGPWRPPASDGGTRALGLTLAVPIGGGGAIPSRHLFQQVGEVGDLGED